MKDQIEKQAIEEMAHIVSNSIMTWANEMPPISNPHFVATNLYNAGYRKQEWISVYERLPETETPVIIFTKKGTYYVGDYYKGAVNPGFTGFYSNGCKRDVTHWMPLPELPKMKGD